MATITFDTSIVKGMLEDALESCAKKTGLRDREQVIKAMHRGDCSVCDHLRYSLAKGMAKYLSSVDDTVKAVYIYEPEYATGTAGTIPGQPRFSPGLSLIAWVSRKSAALSSVISSMNSALGKEYQRFACPEASALCYELDINVADDNEVQKRTGYGALVNSLYVRPIEVWHR